MWFQSFEKETVGYGYNVRLFVGQVWLEDVKRRNGSCCRGVFVLLVDEVSSVLDAVWV